MGQGRGSAKFATTRLVLSFLLIVIMATQTDVSRAAKTFTVGGAGGWTFNVVGWPGGKTFRAGDTLVFKYSPGAHNVVVVDKRGYEKCSTPGGAKVFTTGNDQIKLLKGSNFFICNFPGHCQSAMKIAVTAL